MNNAVTQPNSRLLPKSKPHLNETLSQKQQVRAQRRQANTITQPTSFASRGSGGPRPEAGRSSLGPSARYLSQPHGGGRLKASALLGPATSFPISELFQGPRVTKQREKLMAGEKGLRLQSPRHKLKEKRREPHQQLLRVKWSHPRPGCHTSTTSYCSDSISREISKANLKKKKINLGSTI